NRFLSSILRDLIVGYMIVTYIQTFVRALTSTLLSMFKYCNIWRCCACTYLSYNIRKVTQNPLLLQLIRLMIFVTVGNDRQREVREFCQSSVNIRKQTPRCFIDLIVLIKNSVGFLWRKSEAHAFYNSASTLLLK